MKVRYTFWARSDKGFSLYTMNDLQIKIADETLNTINKNNSRINTSELHSRLDDIFGYKAGIDISYVLDSLEKDYQLIARLGQAWMRLTLEGEKACKIGMNQYISEIHEDKELDKSVKTSTIRSNYFNITNIAITIAASIISTLISLGILKLIIP